jgi:hypothetical protein
VRGGGGRGGGGGRSRGVEEGRGGGAGGGGAGRRGGEEGRFREDVTVWEGGGGVQQLITMYIISVVDF